MIRAFALLGKILLFLAGATLLAGVSFFVLGTYLASWPVMRISPRNRRMRVLMNLAVAGMEVARAYGLDKIPQPGTATDAPEATDTEEGGDTNSHPLG